MSIDNPDIKLVQRHLHWSLEEAPWRRFMHPELIERTYTALLEMRRQARDELFGRSKRVDDLRGDENATEATFEAARADYRLWLIQADADRRAIDYRLAQVVKKRVEIRKEREAKAALVQRLAEGNEAARRRRITHTTLMPPSEALAHLVQAVVDHRDAVQASAPADEGGMFDPMDTKLWRVLNEVEVVAESGSKQGTPIPLRDFTMKDGVPSWRQ